MLKKVQNQSGQTLIETLVACFVLVMGISAALGLANYSLRATTGIKQQIIAMGLAREGLEVVKNMRDTNWLKVPYSTDCYNFSTGDSTGICYRDWLKAQGGFDIQPGNYSLVFQSKTDVPWTLVNTDTDFGLDISSDPGVIYQAKSGLTATASNSGFARKITITEERFPPFDQDIGGRIKVSSQVWWSGKDCELTEQPGTDKSCSLTLETYLTNWRVF